MSDLQPVGYQLWLGDLKAQIQVAQQRAILAVNQELLKLYWQIGNDILQRQQQQGWGSKVIDQLAKDLRVAFPELKGFSARNLKYMRAFAEAWREPEFVQQPVAQLPWGHHLVLLTKLKESSSRLSYAALVQQHGWSRNVLVHQIESQVLQRQGQATTNFAQTLPAPQSELAQQTLKDPYIFDFLSLGMAAHERDIEKALTQQHDGGQKQRLLHGSHVAGGLEQRLAERQGLR